MSNPALPLRDELLKKSSRAFKLVSSGPIKSVSNGPHHVQMDVSGEGGSPTPTQMLEVWQYLIELFDRATLDLGGQQADDVTEVQMEAYLRPITGYTTNWNYIAK